VRQLYHSGLLSIQNRQPLRVSRFWMPLTNPATYCKCVLDAPNARENARVGKAASLYLDYFGLLFTAAIDTLN
jgi:hypothetical protein